VTHLKHLSVRSNGIRDEGAQALAKCLASTSLESLNLGRNSISESVKGQLKAAKKSCSVTVECTINTRSVVIIIFISS
jgi:Ran GTPase-activating protein (RanGAP) involved in mRNA processing and transport